MSKSKKKSEVVKCGIIMPISPFNGYSSRFWGDIREILDEAIKMAGMHPHPVWEDDKNDIIHAKIIDNISNLPVVIGVIIGGNPNVMLECGMRLWTNKPILLINECSEKIPFDVGSISCLSFPENFDYFSVTKLKNQIVEKLKLMLNPEYKTFKSYHSLPVEIEMPNGKNKVGFKQVVEDIRVEIRMLRESMQNYWQKQNIKSPRVVEPTSQLMRIEEPCQHYQSSATLATDLTESTGPSGPIGSTASAVHTGTTGPTGPTVSSGPTCTTLGDI